LDVKTLSQDDLMVMAAWMYYQDGMTQQKIADKLELSRVAVVRMLQRARREKLVQVRITRPLPEIYQLSKALEESFSIKQAVVVKTCQTEEETLEAIGWAAAEHLKELLCHDCRLGFGWSTTVSRMAAYLEKPEKPVRVSVHELAGGLSAHENPYSISAKAAEVLGGSLVSLAAPVLVNSEAAYNVLVKEPTVSHALKEAALVDIAVVGLGNVGPECTMVKVGYLTGEQMRELRGHGAVGDILLRYYDLNGQHVPNPLEERIVSLSWDEILGIPRVVALASGPLKIEVILGALQGPIISDLVTDSETARQVLDRLSKS
jgi:DNA-binding transcriptional regulator LsrR (DeoR family)